MMAPSKEVSRLLGLWQNGQLRLDEMLIRRYSLDDINRGYADMHAGLNIRGTLVFDEPRETRTAKAADEAVSTIQ
jgi:Zn-dependent alcohol dehydrogenase